MPTANAKNNHRHLDTPVTTSSHLRAPTSVRSHQPANQLVGRAGLKLLAAAQAFRFDFRNQVVLDIGSSTGGFTEVALLLGARRVIAVEKGTNQMKAPLRFDSRIDLREKTDFFSLDRASVGPITVVLADVSFVSLTKVLAYAKMAVARRGTQFLVMFKPQFEAAPTQLTKGVVKNECIRRDLIKRFERWLHQQGFIVVNKHDNTLTGKKGNRERFYWLRLG